MFGCVSIVISATCAAHGRQRTGAMVRSGVVRAPLEDGPRVRAAREHASCGHTSRLIALRSLVRALSMTLIATHGGMAEWLAARRFAWRTYAYPPRPSTWPRA